MNAIEALTLRVREVMADTKSAVRISAPVTLICQFIDEFEERGETAEYDDNIVFFGPHLAVYADDDLPPDTFKIQAHRLHSARET